MSAALASMQVSGSTGAGTSYSPRAGVSRIALAAALLVFATPLRAFRVAAAPLQ